MKRFNIQSHSTLRTFLLIGLLAIVGCAPPASLPTDVDTKPTPGEEPGDGGSGTGSDPGGDTGSAPGSGSGDEGGGDPGTTS